MRRVFFDENSHMRGLWVALLFFIAYSLTNYAVSLSLYLFAAFHPALGTTLLGGGTVARLINALVSLFSVFLVAWVALRVLSGSEHRDIGFRSMGFARPRGWRRRLLGGQLFGLALVGLGYGLLLLLGGYSARPGTGGAANILLQLFLQYILFSLVAVQEETLTRGFMLHIMQDMGRWPALIAVSLVFALMHIWNPNVGLVALLNIFLAGLMIGLMLYATGDIWMPIGFHLAWNYGMGFVFGVPVSGLKMENTLLVTEIAEGNVWSGGAFGLEGGLVCTLLLAGGCLLFYGRACRNGRWRPLEMDKIQEAG